MESNALYFRRRATEELAAAHRAVTTAARDRHVELAQRFLARLESSDAQPGISDGGKAERSTRRELRRMVEHALHA